MTHDGNHGLATRVEHAYRTNVFLANHKKRLHKTLRELGDLSTAAYRDLGPDNNTYRAINAAYGALYLSVAMADRPDEAARRIVDEDAPPRR
jgi:hypothetical protein